MIDGSRSTPIWDEVEHGSYRADLPLWEELAAGREPVLDVGCGTGRVAMRLARMGHAIWALDRDPTLVSALEARARDEGLSLHPVVADARTFSIEASFGLVVAAMQLVQLLEGEDGRAAMLRCAAAHLARGALLAAALVDPPEALFGRDVEAPLPDVRELDGWVYSSRPVSVSREDGALVVERLRQTVSPQGELAEQAHVTRLDQLSPAELESEARAAGLTPAGRREISPTHDHVGSTVVLLQKPASLRGEASR